MADIAEIKALAQELCLMNIATGRIDLTDEKISNQDYLLNILRQETELRRKKKADALKKASRLPKKIFDAAKVSSGLHWQLEEISKLDFRNETIRIVIVGECATGKTALAGKIAGDAIAGGCPAVYTTEDDLLVASRRQKGHWNKLLHSDLIVLDDLFYMTPSDENLRLLYKAVMFLSETRSMIFVTNRPLSEWDSMCADRHTAVSFRQRIMTDAQLIHLG